MERSSAASVRYTIHQVVITEVLEATKSMYARLASRELITVYSELLLTIHIKGISCMIYSQYLKCNLEISDIYSWV